MMLLVFSAFARDIDVKVHDRDGVVSGDVQVDLVGSAGKVTYTCRDDGVAPDAVAGDRMYTAHAEGLAIDGGEVTVRAGGRTWTGNFGFDPESDAVLLVGLGANGRADASTHEVMFVPEGPMGRGPAGAPAGAVPGGGGPGGVPGGGVPARGVPGGGVPGGVPGGGGPGATPGDGGANASIAPPGTIPGGASPDVPGTGAASMAPPGGVATHGHTRTGLPDGMWAGWLVGAASLAGLGALAFAGSRRPARVPPIAGPRRDTRATRGPWTPGGPALYVGDPPSEDADASRIGHGRWTPEEIALAAVTARCERVVVTDPARVEAPGDAFRTLAAALSGICDLLWVE